MGNDRQLRSENRQLRLDAHRLRTELKQTRQTKRELQTRLNQTTNIPEPAQVFLTELHYLSEIADPTPSRPTDGNARNAETPTPGASTRWYRTRLDQILTRLGRLTIEIQTTMGTPPEERYMTDTNGRCVGCGRRGKQR